MSPPEKHITNRVQWKFDDISCFFMIVMYFMVISDVSPGQYYINMTV